MAPRRPTRRSDRAIALFSGGLDSATVLYWAAARGLAPHALIFDYGQRHRRELRSALAICAAAGVPHDVVRLSLPWGGSSLLGRRQPLPQAGSVSEIGRTVPSTYVPARNTVFLAFGLSCAEALGASAVLIGANALDYSGYPDCRPDYLAAMAKVYYLGTVAGRRGKPIRIAAPLLHKTKAGIIRMGTTLGVPYELTWSCYRGGQRPCGVCESCLLRAKGFAEAGRPDPLINHRQPKGHTESR